MAVIKRALISVSDKTGIVEFARAQSVEAVQVKQPSDIEPAIRQALSHSGPFLIDVVLEGDVHPELIGVKCGQ